MTTQLPIAAIAGSSTVVTATDNTRRFLYLRNYTGSADTLWIAFGRPATAGSNGELELAPGEEISFGGKLESNLVGQPTAFQQNCPVESINVIATSTTATGCVLTY